jgi:hypothetical protein
MADTVRGALQNAPPERRKAYLNCLSKKSSSAKKKSASAAKKLRWPWPAHGACQIRETELLLLFEVGVPWVAMMITTFTP